jgi:hypothetical protein
MTDADEIPTVPVKLPEDAGLAVLRALKLDTLKPGMGVSVSYTRTTTDRFRVIVSFLAEKTSKEIGDRVMRLEDLVLDLHVFSAENLAAVVVRQQAAGAGTQL